MKKGNKRAIKLHNTEEGAKKHLDKLGKEYYIDVRLGERTRCLHYCEVKPFCPYMKEKK